MTGTRTSWESVLEPEGKMFHSDGIMVDIVSIKESSRDCSCETHNTVIYLWSLQIVVVNHEEPTIAAYWIVDGIDWCQDGLHLLQHYLYTMEKLLKLLNFWISPRIHLNRDSHTSQNRGLLFQAAIVRVAILKSLFFLPHWYALNLPS